MKLTYEQQRVLAGMNEVDGPLVIRNRKGKILKQAPPAQSNPQSSKPHAIPRVVATAPKTRIRRPRVF